MHTTAATVDPKHVLLVFPKPASLYLRVGVPTDTPPCVNVECHETILDEDDKAPWLENNWNNFSEPPSPVSKLPEFRLRGGGIVNKLNTNGIPKLSKNASDAEAFLNWAIPMKSWASMSGAAVYIFGPVPMPPAPIIAANGDVTNQDTIDDKTESRKNIYLRFQKVESNRHIHVPSKHLDKINGAESKGHIQGTQGRRQPPPNHPVLRC